MRWVGYPQGLHLDRPELERWLAAINASPDRRHFVIRDAVLGFCGELFYEVARTTRRAALDVKLVPEVQRRGIATSALRRLIDLVFDHEPDVEVVWTEPWLENEAAQRLYARCELRPKPRPSDLPPGPSYWALGRAERS